MANLTLSPNPWQTFFTDAGLIASNHKLFTYAAGTSDKLATYTDVGGLVAHPNPIILDSAGRVPSGFFLLPASYKFVLSPASDTDPPTNPIRSQDNVGAIPGTTLDQDIAIVAGEALTANDAAYVSDGSGGLTAGRAYKADADTAYSSTVSVVGFVVADVASGVAGSMRVGGRMTGFLGLTAGAAHYLSASAGTITPTPPPNARYVGQADSVSSLLIGPNPRPYVVPQVPCGRLTLTTGVPVTVTDVGAATAVFFAPYQGNTITLYDGTRWIKRSFAQISIAVPAGADAAYDVFVYDNAGTVTLELTAWTNLTTRATALTTQDGFLVKTGVVTRLYLGSFRTTGVSGQTEDSFAKRYLWNYYHRVRRALRVRVTTNSWTYTVATIRQANATATNQVEVFVGVAEVQAHVNLSIQANQDTGAPIAAGIGEDSTTAFSTNGIGAFSQVASGEIAQMSATVDAYPAVGWHRYTWLEWVTASGTTTFYTGNSVIGGIAGGLSGWIEG